MTADFFKNEVWTEDRVTFQSAHLR